MQTLAPTIAMFARLCARLFRRTPDPECRPHQGHSHARHGRRTGRQCIDLDAVSAPLLIVIGGLPGTGKTTLARVLARRLRAIHLRIDSIEQAIRSAGVAEVGIAGYTVGNALAHANLTLGLGAVADCVNPVSASRQGWAATAAAARAALIQVHLVCSNSAEHRRRVEDRTADLYGLAMPDWTSVSNFGVRAMAGRRPAPRHGRISSRGARR